MNDEEVGAPRRHIIHNRRQVIAQGHWNIAGQRHGEPGVGDTPCHPSATFGNQPAVAQRDSAQGAAPRIRAQRLMRSDDRCSGAIGKQRRGHLIRSASIGPQMKRAQLQTHDHRHRLGVRSTRTYSHP